MIRFALHEIPDGAVLRSVTAEPAAVQGRPGLGVELTDAITAHGAPDIDFIDAPTFVQLPVAFTNGTIDVDIFSTLTEQAPADARAFAGIAYRIRDGHFEAVYLRPTNGRKLKPPAPRDRRAVQYFAYPDWRYARLRDAYPDGRYEAGANIAPGEWIHLRLEVTTAGVTATIDGITVLQIHDPKGTPTPGSIGLFVDIGTKAYFANLTIQPAAGQLAG